MTPPALCPKCHKAIFETERAANRRIRDIAAFGRPQRKRPVRAYFSPACGWWHLTSRPTPMEGCRR
jgi:hypothetical protein